MASSSVPDDDLYEDASDGAFANLADDALNPPSYAQAASTGVSLEEGASHNDGNEDSNDVGSGHRADDRPPFDHGDTPFRILSDIERNNFHPLNVTPSRPCTAFFRVGEDVTSKQIFDSFRNSGIPVQAVRCLQRKPSGDVVVTFSTAQYRDLFLQHSPLIERRKYPTHPDSSPLVFLTIYDAPHELPESAIEHRLKPFCKVYSRRRGRVQGYPDACNGIRHYRVSLFRNVPCYLRFGRFQLRFYHDGQQKTCRKCGSPDHLARDCENSVCFNCDTIGHTAKECTEAMRCCICKSTGHKAVDCPLSWHRRPVPASRSSSPRAENAVNAEDPAEASSQPATRDGATPANDDASDNEEVSPSAADGSNSSAPMDTTPRTADADSAGGTIPPPSSPPSALDPQGFLMPYVDLTTLTVHPGTFPISTAESSVLDDLVVSDDADEFEDVDEDLPDDDADEIEIVLSNDGTSADTPTSPSPSITESLPLAAAVRKLATGKKKIGRRNPAKISTATQPPARKATLPSAPSARKAFKQSDSSEVDVAPT